MNHSVLFIKLMSSIICGDKIKLWSTLANVLTRQNPERRYGSDVWYLKCDVLVPHVLPNFVLLYDLLPPISLNVVL